MQLYEKYRPRSLAEVVAQPKAVERIERLRRSGLAGRAYWVSGNSGTGKTTLARIIAGEVADEFFVWEGTAEDLTSDRLREIERESHLTAWGKGGRAFIVNEAHGLRRATIRKLEDMLEAIPPHVVWIFTTTRDGQDRLFDDHEEEGPILSRCQSIPLTTQGLADPFAAAAKDIAIAEGLDGRPLADYKRLVQKRKNNLRAVIQDIEAGAMMVQ